MSREIRILQHGLGASCASLDPAELSARSPAWGADLRAVGPLTETTLSCAPSGAASVLAADAPGQPVVWIGGRCSSSMDLAWELARSGALSPWDAVLAVEQSSGRGQLRRPWSSTPGNLHVSFFLRTPPAPWEGLLSLVAGHVLCEALAELGAEPRIKWPNDLYADGRKVGGILVEQRGDDVVVGLGLNLVRAPGDCEMRKDAAAPAGVLQWRDPDSGPLRAWLALVTRAKNAYVKLLKNNSPTDFLSLVSRRLLWLGLVIFHQEGGQWRRARVIGLHHDGGLILEREGKRDVVYSGSLLFERP